MLTIALVALVLATMIAIGAAVVFQRRISGEIDVRLAEAHTRSSARLEEPEVEGQPAPVQRWLRYSRA